MYRYAGLASRAPLSSYELVWWLKFVMVWLSVRLSTKKETAQSPRLAPTRAEAKLCRACANAVGSYVDVRGAAGTTVPSGKSEAGVPSRAACVHLSAA